MECFTQYVTERMKATRQDLDNLFDIWYQDILRLADRIGSVESVPRKTNLQRNRSNTFTSSRSPIEQYKRSVAIPLLDFLLLQMRERSNGEQGNVRALLCLVLTLLVRSDVDPMKSRCSIPEVSREYGKANTRKCKEQGKERKTASRPYPTINYPSPGLGSL